MSFIQLMGSKRYLLTSLIKQPIPSETKKWLKLQLCKSRNLLITVGVYPKTFESQLFTF